MRKPWLVILCSLFTAMASAQTPSVALTFDDLPAVNTNDPAEVKSINLSLLDELDRRHAPATAFVIGNIADLTPQSRPMLQEWKRRGYSIGNHTWSHNNFAETPLDQEEYDILHGEKTIAPLLSPGVRFLRFPYNGTGDTPEKHAAILAFLKARHYQIATCTIDNEDYLFAGAYSKMLARHDDASAARLRQTYLDYTATEIDFYTQLHRQLFGREIPHVMLLHASRLNADTIAQVIDIFAARHYQFISLTQAQSDPAYATPDTFATKYGPMWAYRWSHVLGIKFTGTRETEPPDWIAQYGK